MDLPAFRFIEPDVAVYLYYAGRDRKFMKTSQAEEAVFLDLPGFLTDASTFASEDGMIRSLNRADAVKRYLRDPVNAPRPGPISSFSKMIPHVENRIDRSFVADLSNVRTMFVDMKIGDIVMMTPSDHYERLLIGEVKSDWNPDQTMTLPGQADNALPYREVTWLSHSLSRRDFPVNVARKLQNRKAITRIDSDLYDSIFRFLYSAYVWGNTSKLDIFGPNYNSNDPTANIEASFIIKYAVAYYSAYTKGEIDKFNAMSLEEAAEQYFDYSLVIQVAQAFGSPGGYVSKFIGGGAAAAVALIITVALSSEAQPVSLVQQQATVEAQAIQSGHANDIGFDLPGLASSITIKKSEELRTKYGRQAKSKIGMTLQGERPPELTARDRAPRI